MQAQFAGVVADVSSVGLGEQRDSEVGKEQAAGRTGFVIEAFEQGGRAGEVTAMPRGDDPGRSLGCIGGGAEATWGSTIRPAPLSWPSATAAQRPPPPSTR
ncbi:hypothetical protein [uncultured Jatrophihabitans sp.]|uniref:hypothetical protein n=1 Tax=uncultured Jatrophihabitans sp. TaxID=1610747 RepID=UPI0035CAF0FD